MSPLNIQVLQSPQLHNIRQRSTIIALPLLFLTARFSITNRTLNRADLCKRWVILMSLSINPDPIIRIRRLEKRSDIGLSSRVAVCVFAGRAYDIRTGAVGP